jgi:hypothetical protein
LIARDTVIGDTPTFAATSLMVARRPRRPGTFNVDLLSSAEELLVSFGAGTSRSFSASVRSQLVGQVLSAELRR